MSEIGSLNATEVTVAPDQVARLEITSWNSVQSENRFFKCGKMLTVSGLFIIMITADGGTRVGDTAGLFLNLETGRLVTDLVSDHEELEVLDPSAEDLASGAGVGKRITLMDASAKTLVDVIIGKADGDGGHYMRLPSENKVYAVSPARSENAFADWLNGRSLKKRAVALLMSLSKITR